MQSVSFDSAENIWSSNQTPALFPKDDSVGQIIFEVLQRQPKKIAQISATENTVLTREELLTNSMRIASYLRNLGLKQTDIVGIAARNTTHICSVVYACFFNGIAYHALNWKGQQTTIEKLFTITKPRIIFCDGDEYEKIKAATEQLQVRIITMRNHVEGSIKIEELLRTPIEENFSPARLENGNDQNLAILSSSGTTGLPKAVTVRNTHGYFNDCFSVTSDDIMFTNSTFDWMTGLMRSIICGAFGAMSVIATADFDRAYVLSILEKYKVTWFFFASGQLAQMVNCVEFDKTDLSSLRRILYGGGPCSVENQKQFRSKVQKGAMNFFYSMSEITGYGCINFHFDEKINAVGRVTTGFQLKIINEHGKALGANEVGEVCHRSNQYWAGYYGDPAETSKMQDKDLWFHSGDLGYVDEDGFLYIVDRKKEMLKYINFKYYPREIEELIAKMPGVADVCAFGIFSDEYGDEAAAVVVKMPGTQITAQDVVEYVQQHEQSKHLHLHAGVIIVDDLKRLPNGKTDRKANKAHFLKLKN
ncbi:maker584 [Drosophila busckii]|uniref:Maker581 n=1 Tax=Drosophila busckii TaxID=30019 RepID=A0A0M4ES34_DROBS|nr:maker581 [Drosophila busckii]ALC40075.1 maker584 [Drosophila busckii]